MKYLMVAAALMFAVDRANAGGVAPVCPGQGSTQSNCYKTVSAAEIQNVEAAAGLVIFRSSNRPNRDVQFDGSGNATLANRFLSLLLTAKTTGSDVVIYISNGDWNASGDGTITFSNMLIP